MITDSRKNGNPLLVSTAPKLFHGVRYQVEEGGKIKNKINATVKTHKVTWPKLVEQLSKLKVNSKKENCPYLVFASFKDTLENKEYYRHNSNVDQFHGCTIDVDDPDSPFDIDDIKAVLDSKSINYALYSTHSYDPLAEGKDKKFRVVIPYSEPVEKNDQPFVVMGIASLLGLQNNFDECSKTASQPMYWHSAPASRKDEAIFLARTDAAMFDPDEAHSIGQMMAEEQGVAGRTYEVSPSSMKVGVDFTEGQRHNQFIGYMKRRKEEGADIESIISEIHVMNEKLSSPLPDDQVEGLRRVWETFERNDNAFGFNHHMQNIEVLPMQQKEVYDTVLRQIANSEKLVDPAERAELFNKIKSKRAGSTLKTIEAHFKELTAEKKEETAVSLADLRIKSDKYLKKRMKSYVLMLEEAKILDTTNNSTYPRDIFKLKVGQVYEDAAQKYGMGFRELKLGRDYVFEQELIREAARTGYKPAAAQIYENFEGAMIYNRYKEPQWTGLGSDTSIELLHNHMKYLIPDPEDRLDFTMFLACLIQKPHIKIEWCPVLKGKQGTGKSWVIEKLMPLLLGRGNVVEVDNDRVRNTFPRGIFNHQLAFFSEVDWGAASAREALAITNVVKQWITAPVLELQDKNVKHAKVENHTSFVGFTNKRSPMVLSSDDRRWLFINAATKPRSKEYYDSLFAALENDEWLEAVYTYLMEMDISSFDPKSCRINKVTDELRSVGGTWADRACESILVHEMSPIFELAAIRQKDVYDLVKCLALLENDQNRGAMRLGGRGSSHATVEVKGALLERDFVETGRIRIGSGEDKVWLTPNTLSLSDFKKMHSEERVEELDHSAELISKFIRDLNAEDGMSVDM